MLAIVVGLPWITRHVLQRGVAALRDRYGCELTTGRVELALTSLAITLHDVKLACGAASDPPLVAADRVNVDVALAALGGTPAFDRIHVVNPKVSWKRARAYARTSHPRAPAPVFEVGRLEIVGLDANLTTSASVRLTVRGVSASFDGAGPGRRTGVVAVRQGVQLEVGAVAATVEELRSELTIDGETLVIREFVARSPDGELHLDGRVGLAGAGGYALSYVGRLDLDARQPWRHGPPVTGRVSLNGSISGALSSPTATFHLRAADLQWSAIANLESLLGATSRRRAMCQTLPIPHVFLGRAARRRSLVDAHGEGESGGI